MYQYNQSFGVFNSEFSPEIKMNYLIAEPCDRGENEQLPMIVFLHGAGERGTDPARIKTHGVPKMLDGGLPVRAVILAPQVPDIRHVWNTVMDPTMELIKKTAEKHNVDFDRISLTGISMGGYGTWELATSNDKFFSAIAPICGGGMSWRGEILKDMPIRAFHGDKDGIVPISTTYEMVDNINWQGGSAAFMILHNIDHDSWLFAYEQTNLLSWLANQNRKNKGDKNYSSWANISDN